MATNNGGIAPTSTRTLWKGAISFGLVHIPVGLYSATAETDLDFDWLDKRTMERVGYKRINKSTGKEIAAADIVKGIEYEDGHYVILSPQEIEAAYPKTTQTIEIEAFIQAGEIPFVYLERPYYVAPINRGSKVYALLRETLRETQRVGIAKVVIQTRQHLAVLIPCGPALILNLLRWGDEIRSWDQLSLPATGKDAGLKAGEKAMAKQLVDEMTTRWEPDRFRDSFKEQVMKLVEEKARAGKLETVREPEGGKDAAPAGAEVLDLTELLKRSIASGKRSPPAKGVAVAPGKKAAPAKASASSAAPARKTSRTRKAA